jgi:hypothetical protein
LVYKPKVPHSNK